MCGSHLATQLLQRRIVEQRLPKALDLSELLTEFGARDGRVELRHVISQRLERGVEEGVSGRVGGAGHATDEVERGAAGADDGDGAQRQGAAVVGGEVAGGAQRLDGFKDHGPGRGTGGLEVDEEVQRLVAAGVVDAVEGGRGGEARNWVLSPESVEDGLDVEGVEGPVLGQGTGFVADLDSCQLFDLFSNKSREEEHEIFAWASAYVKSAVDEPNIGLYRHGAVGKRRVERYISPVVVVRVKRFLRSFRISAAPCSLYTQLISPGKYPS